MPDSGGRAAAPQRLQRPSAPLVRWRRAYGAGPVQLLVVSAGFVVPAYVVTKLVDNPSLGRIGLWFIGAVVAHDLIAFPVYALLDRGLRRVTTRRGAMPRISATNHLRVPAAASVLLLLVYLPGIIRQGAATYRTATGQTQQPFLGRWVLITAVLFGLSVLIYSVRLLLARRAPTGSRDDAG